MIEKGLVGKVFIKDQDGSFILLGQDAIEKAIERNDTAKRPMYRGVVSAKEKDAKLSQKRNRSCLRCETLSILRTERTW